MKCELCDEYGDRLTLVGMVPAELCLQHRREFANAAVLWDEFGAHNVTAMRLTAVQHAGDEDRAAVLAKQLQQTDDTMRELVLKWLAEHKEVNDAAKTDTP